jgi:hypothetical protein
MVQSHLNQSVNYEEKREIDPADLDHESSIFEVEILKHNYLIALGKPNYTFATKYDIVYFPIYLLKGYKTIRGKIGVYEIEKNRLLRNNLGENIEVLGEPLLFDITTVEYLKKTKAVFLQENVVDEFMAKEEEFSQKIKINKKSRDNIVSNTIPDDEDRELSDEENELSLAKPDKSSTTKLKLDDSSKEKYITIDTVFVKDKTPPNIPTWPTETEEDAKKMREEYQNTKSVQDNWVQTFMKNKNYGILRNEGGGDCLFATIRDAFSEIGYHTTVQKLRQILSQEATITQLETLTDIYRGILHGEENALHEMERISKANQNLKKQAKSTPYDKIMGGKQQLKEVVAGARELHKSYQSLKSKHEVDSELLREFGYMKNIHTLEDLRRFIRTSDYWADTWAISTLERVLQIKIIILEDNTDPNSVMRCGQLNDEISSFSPKFYLMTNYTMNGNHYELISYKKKKLFQFSEVPYDIKILIVNKCMERAAGSYSIIPALRQFQNELGLQESEDLGESEESDRNLENEDLYEKDLVFMFHNHSDNSKKPGKGTGETIDAKRIPEFAELITSKKPWRQMLDDDWSAQFTLDHLRWSSISHYLLALPFQKSEPQIYKEFSLDGGNETLSKNLEDARSAIEKKKGKEGKYYDKYKLVSKSGELGPDELENARKDALIAKFSQNADLTTILKLTKRAQLKHFLRGKAAESDTLLMTVRKQLLK